MGRLFNKFFLSSWFWSSLLNFWSPIHNVWALKFGNTWFFLCPHTSWCKQVMKKGRVCLVIRLCQTFLCWQEKHFWKAWGALKVFLPALKTNPSCTSVFQATQTEIISETEITQKLMSSYTVVKALKSKCSTDSLHYKSMLHDKL